jgi:tRNA-uridine 2-sulfurtransferase
MKIKNCKLKITKQKVLVAMSGGVDSSVCAAILKKNGYDVVGVFMRMHEKSNPKDARIVAQKLKIPFKVLDVRKKFKEKVIDYFIKEYERGNTPNPCVECNPQIKFKFLIDLAIKMKAEFMATGHYARIKNKRLFIAKDIKKDQSYFLWQLNQKQLSKVIFPLGDYTKEEVRGLAKKFKLPVFDKKDSQDVCFSVPQKSFHAKAGDIITKDNKKIGKHKGLPFYTIGQRKGIEIGGTGPYYVVRKDFKNNALIVSNNQKDLLRKEMMVKNINWLSGKSFSGKCKVKIRSMAPMVLAIIKKNKVIFNNPQRAITSGQSAVFYKNKNVLGGGVIL